jgi:putative tryptophan/tyrosine transport system substrate-binding protein
MRRRGFIQAAVLSTAVPPIAGAQQIAQGSRIAKVGVLWQLERTDEALLKSYRAPLTRTLQGLGYVEGKNIQFVERVSNDAREFRELAKELVDQAPDVIVASSQLAALDLKQATTTIPIVFATAPNPLGSGLVESLARPGGNATGLSLMVVDTSGKRLDLFKEAVPTLRRVALIFDPKEPPYFTNVASYAEPAKALGLELRHVEISSPDAIAPTYSAIAKDGFDGVVAVGIMVLLERARIGAAALVTKVPTTVFAAECVPYGFLMSYGIDIAEYFSKAAIYVDKILKGAKPADLPVEQPTHLKLVINLKVAEALGLTMSPSLLAAADEVIE